MQVWGGAVDEKFNVLEAIYFLFIEMNLLVSRFKVHSFIVKQIQVLKHSFKISRISCYIVFGVNGQNLAHSDC
jgi:hypothetical protein